MKKLVNKVAVVYGDGIAGRTLTISK